MKHLKRNLENKAPMQVKLLECSRKTQKPRNLLKKLDFLTGQSSETPAWFKSHPKVKDRLKTVREGSWSEHEAMLHLLTLRAKMFKIKQIEKLNPKNHSRSAVNRGPGFRRKNS